MDNSENGTHPLHAERINHVWSDDLGFDPTGSSGRPKWVTVLDELSRECLTQEVKRPMTCGDVTEILDELGAQ